MKKIGIRKEGRKRRRISWQSEREREKVGKNVSAFEIAAKRTESEPRTGGNNGSAPLVKALKALLSSVAG